jgi:hypothetical protein
MAAPLLFVDIFLNTFPALQTLKLSLSCHNLTVQDEDGSCGYRRKLMDSGASRCGAYHPDSKIFQSKA